jgi:hypothetical protein
MSLLVKKINKKIAASIVSEKHYSRRLGIFWEGFGLFENEVLLGVCCFGQPSPAIQKHAFKDRDFRLYELTRLVVDEGVENGASFLISQSIKQLSQRPCAIVSYADSMHGHCGIVYQATNWIYTGGTVSHDKLYCVDGKIFHPMTLRDHFGTTHPAQWVKENSDKFCIQTIKPHPKHRYFFFCGSKKEKKTMKHKLAYPQQQYPKTEKTLYNSGDVSCNEIYLKVDK